MHTDVSLVSVTERPKPPKLMRDYIRFASPRYVIVLVQKIASTSSLIRSKVETNLWLSSLVHTALENVYTCTYLL